MAITWQLLVWAADGTAKDTITVDGSIAALVGLDVDGAGNCLEAEFVAVPSEVDIVARDIIQLQVQTDGVTWTSVYKGYIAIAGAPRADDFRTYKAVGLKQRFYEILLTEPVIGAADVATMVDQAISSLPLPTGVTYAAADVSTQTFQLGDRYPRLEYAGEFLDAVTDSVGSFIVPTGSNYTFNGVTYDSGDTVPATRWGVRGDGSFYFTRPQATAVEVDENSRDVLVTWSDVAAEEVYDGVNLVFASEYAGLDGFSYSEGGTAVGQPAPFPIAYTVQDGNYESTRRVTLDAPLDFMMNGALVVNAMAGWSNPSNAVDGDNSTFAESTDDSGPELLLGATWPTGSPGVIVRARYQLSGTQIALFSGGTADENLRLKLTWKVGSGRFDDGVFGAERKFLPVTDSPAIEDVYWVLPTPADVLDDAVSLHLSFVAASGMRIYEVEAWVVDQDAASLLAEGYLRSPQSDASLVELVGQLGSVSQDLTLTPVDELAVTVPVERIEYTLTNEAGLQTVYHLGQAFDAERLSQRAVHEALSARIAKRVTR